MDRERSNVNFVVAGLLLGILIAAIDNTIVATAMGTIISELGGLEQFTWVTSAYMVASMAGTPIFGKLSDMYGRKRFFIFGLFLFLIGSILCGTSKDIFQLSLYRAIQGVGGGALMPIAFTIVFDIFPPEKRGKMSGLLGAVFGMSSIIGPLLGAYITEYFSWRWVFYINIPLGLICFSFIFPFYHESLEHRKQVIDWWGALTLVVSVVSLMFALEFGGTKYSWNSSVILFLFAIFLVFFIVFLWIEKKAKEPIVSFQMFKNRLFATSNGAAFFYGATFILATIYIPIFIQGVMGGSATNSGILLMPMMIGSVIGAQSGGFLMTRLTYRNTMIVSAVFFLIGTYLLGMLTPNTTRLLLTLYMVLIGIGVGFSFSVLNNSAIEGFEIRRRGSATSTIQFLRSLGMTLGISVFGIIQRNDFTTQLTTAFAHLGQAPSGFDPRSALSPEARTHIPPAILGEISNALADSIAHTFKWSLVAAILGVVSVLLMGKGRVRMGKGTMKAKKLAQE